MLLLRLSSTSKVDHPSNQADTVADSKLADTVVDNKLAMAAVPPHHLGPRLLEMSGLTRN